MALPTVITDADFRKQLSTSPALGYLLFGEEDYLKQLAVSYAKQTLCPDEALSCFNLIVLDAVDHTPDALPEVLRDALMALPMMADRKLVILRGMDFEHPSRPHTLDRLCEVLAELPEYDYNTLLIPVPAGLIDDTCDLKKKRISKALSRLGESLTLVSYERCTPAKLSGWCIRHFKHNGVDASPALANALIEACGRQMLTLAAEIDKISYYVLAHGRTEAAVEDIAAVACTTVEYDTFAFSNALIDRDMARALYILSDLKFRRTDPLLIMGNVASTYCEMLSVLLLTREGKTDAEVAKLTGLHDFRVSLYRRSATSAGEDTLRRMIEACDTADRALKSSPKGYEALEVLLCSV